MFGQSILLAAVCQFLTLTAALQEEFDSLSPRPSIAITPQGAFKPFPFSPARHKTCHVKSHGDGTDDSKYILRAFRKCSPGGRVVFDKGKVYTIGKAMDIRFLKRVDVDIQGKIVMTNDIDYWLANSFKYAFQDSSSFVQIGGTDINIYGGGEIDGNGQAWWDARMNNKTIQRPILVTYMDLHGGSVSNITLRNSPNWFQLVFNSSNIVFDSMYLNASSSNSNPTANSGEDTYRSDNIVIQNSRIFNSDDCVSFKPNSTNILVQNLYCNGSHGISVGSLGQYVGQVDIVENILVYNTSLNNASDGARIKIWPGAIGNSTNTGGGSGWVRNVTYDGMHNYNNDWAIEMTQCYFAPNQTACNEHPASLIVEDILFKNFDGTTSKKRAPFIATLVCSSPDVCKNIRAENINVLSPSGTDEAICTNMDRSLLDLHCTKG
ncbi:putative polygalacturonase [Aspergillus fischeri NRRL 181]|uniref:galacturonan 1,4-alpha-galacturonidase n=1 Tax=Neosartorya fischeri (strain ATCC 1020 / DSM 3700 / CBS 544.65 / FGSC A1164 / JCM 1740 / NRRL 181 / WB 181) TaxID=331117 RepID=A1DBY5_NEOFI|nr:polygalacturonase, putative [Aspergillus fischeri NRRL 181]EAW20375.1 polygalacturonase, putative [Aspergillus fischeri NRRL 181]